MTQQPQVSSPPASKQRYLRWGLALGSLALIVACCAVRYYWGLGAATAQAPAEASPTVTVPAEQTPAASTEKAAVDPATMPVVAVVNGEEISREELARECLRRSGKEVLETIVNKRLIAQECERCQLSVTPSEAGGHRAVARRFP